MPFDSNDDVSKAVASARQPDLVTEDDVAGTWSPRANPAQNQTVNSYSPSSEAAPKSFMEKLPDVLYNRFVDPMVKAITAPGRVYRGEVPENQMIDEAKNVAGQMMTGSFALGAPSAAIHGVEPNQLNMFFGPRSKTANLQALEEATYLEGAGLDRDRIWKTTGWGRGPDGQWFYEVPDNTAQLRALRMGTEGPIGRESTLGAEFEHPELYKAYPDLANLKFEHGFMKNANGAYAYPQAGFDEQIAIGAEDPKFSLLHEIQHAIQNREGWPRGGNPSDRSLMPIAQLIKERGQENLSNLQAEMHGYFDKYAREAGYQPNDPNRIDIIKAASQKWREENPEKAAQMVQAYKDAAMPGSARDAYQRLVGEIQANRTALSQHWDAADRRAVPAWYRGDFPLDKNQIIRYGTDEPFFPSAIGRAEGGAVRQGYATLGGTPMPDNLEDAKNIAYGRDASARAIDDKIRALTSNAQSGLDMAVQTPYFGTGLDRPSLGGAGMLSLLPKPAANIEGNEFVKTPKLSDIKMLTPLEEMEAKRIPTGELLPTKPLSFEDMFKTNARIFPAVGDKTLAGHILHMGDEQIPLQGGPGYMQTGKVWASDLGKTKGFAKRIGTQLQEGETPYMMHVTMGPQAGDFSTMMSDSLLAQLPQSKVFSKTAEPAVKSFDDRMMAISDTWPGIRSPQVRDYLNNAPGEFRSAFAKAMDMKPFRDAGFPNVPLARFSITDPNLLYRPSGLAGYATSKVDPSLQVVTGPQVAHNTYTGGLLPAPNAYQGTLENLMPARTVWRDYVKTLPESSHGDVNQEMYAIERAFPGQKLDQQLLDTLMTNQDLYKRYGPSMRQDGGRTDGNNAVDNALRIARGHFDEGGDTGESRDKEWTHDYNSSIGNDNNDNVRADNLSQSEQRSADSQAASDARAYNQNVGRFAFGNNYNVGNTNETGVSTPQNFQQYTKQRLDAMNDYQNSLLNAAMHPSDAYGMLYPNLVGVENTRAGASGLLGSGMGESGKNLDPSAINGGSIGMFQDTGARATALKLALGIDPSLRGNELRDALAGTQMGQLGFGLNEIVSKPDYAPTARAMATGTNAADVADVALKNFERPTLENQISSAPSREAYAQNIMAGRPSGATMAIGSYDASPKSFMDALMSGVKQADTEKQVTPHQYANDATLAQSSMTDAVNDPAVTAARNAILAGATNTSADKTSTSSPLNFLMDRIFGGLTSRGITNPAGYSLGLSGGENPQAQQGQDLLDKNTPQIASNSGTKNIMSDAISQAVAAAQAPTTPSSPYLTELGKYNQQLPSVTGQTAQQWALANTGGDMSRVHGRIKYVNGAPMLEYYAA
jgi:hypothetical protein